ncbi:hypothetical protein NSMM_310035 [Nitrosomonas mobilis]|uniref:Uncharacterized protein n=1 Tax=Nitrosomonas mobilis TaxID=51642 RepID=A0A1G5SCP1_9PROT|nr:hypothetical protein NSMM_310035 [Nitrosomonas mobilis]
MRPIKLDIMRWFADKEKLLPQTVKTSIREGLIYEENCMR